MNFNRLKSFQMGFLAQNPICADCEPSGRIRLADYCWPLYDLGPREMVTTANTLPLCGEHYRGRRNSKKRKMDAEVRVILQAAAERSAQ